METLEELREQARSCTRCPLYEPATQTVFGEGPPGAWLMLVGEQPGDQEDRKGAPFVGPAGRVLDDALERAGIARDGVYVTNAVKHFRFERDGKRRIHKTPGVTHIRACRPWLDGELAVVRPAVIGVLGATAGKALLGPQFRITAARQGAGVRGPVPGGDGAPVVDPARVARGPRGGAGRDGRGRRAHLVVAAHTGWLRRIPPTMCAATTGCARRSDRGHGAHLIVAAHMP